MSSVQNIFRFLSHWCILLPPLALMVGSTWEKPFTDLHRTRVKRVGITYLLLFRWIDMITILVYSFTCVSGLLMYLQTTLILNLLPCKSNLCQGLWSSRVGTRRPSVVRGRTSTEKGRSWTRKSGVPEWTEVRSVHDPSHSSSTTRILVGSSPLMTVNHLYVGSKKWRTHLGETRRQMF